MPLLSNNTNVMPYPQQAIFNAQMAPNTNMGMKMNPNFLSTFNMANGGVPQINSVPSMNSMSSLMSMNSMRGMMPAETPMQAQYQTSFYLSNNHNNIYRNVQPGMFQAGLEGYLQMQMQNSIQNQMNMNNINFNANTFNQSQMNMNNLNFNGNTFNPQLPMKMNPFIDAQQFSMQRLIN